MTASNVYDTSKLFFKSNFLHFSCHENHLFEKKNNFSQFQVFAYSFLFTQIGKYCEYPNLRV